MSDSIEQRLRSANPVPPDVTVPPASNAPARTIVGAIVQETSSPVSPGRRNVAMIAVAAAVIVAIGAVVLLRSDNSTTPTTMALSVPGGASQPGGPATNACIVLSPDIIGAADVAFDGTVTDVGAGSVTLDVSKWFKGGDADQVQLSVTDVGVAVAMDGIDFEDGARYLVAATAGVVNSCGQSALFSADLEALYGQAFP